MVRTGVPAEHRGARRDADIGAQVFGIAGGMRLAGSARQMTPLTTKRLADVKALKPGDNVTLQCVSEGWEIGPQLKDCVVVK